MATIGVALAVPEPWGSRLQEYREACGDRAAALIPTHITLIPPVEVDDLDEVIAHLEQVAARNHAFDVRLRRTGTFRPVSPVVFVMVAEGIACCEQLANDARQGPLAVELSFPYHPHVTVAQNLDDGQLDVAFAGLADFECVYQVAEFHLYTHDESVGWQPKRTFALAPQSPQE